MSKGKSRRTYCTWCGTWMRGRDKCPRGTCETELADHNRLMERIENAKTSR